MLLRRSVPYARRVALTGAERFRTWICRVCVEGEMGRKEQKAGMRAESGGPGGFRLVEEEVGGWCFW